MEKDFKTVYKAWLEVRQWAEKTELTAKQRKIMKEMDMAKKIAWNSMPEARRREIVIELIGEGILPTSVLKCMEIFDARMVCL